MKEQERAIHVKVLLKILDLCEVLQELVEPFLVFINTNIEVLHVEFLNPTKLDVVGKILQNLGQLCCESGGGKEGKISDLRDHGR